MPVKLEQLPVPLSTGRELVVSDRVVRKVLDDGSFVMWFRGTRQSDILDRKWIRVRGKGISYVVDDGSWLNRGVG